MAWDVINTTDYIALWRGIDENKESGYYLSASIREELRSRQEFLRTSDIITVFLEEVGALPLEERKKEIKVGDLYHKYRVWCDETGHFFSATTVFGRQVVNRGIERRLRTIQNKSVRLYVVNYNTDIVGLEVGMLTELRTRKKMEGEI